MFELTPEQQALAANLQGMFAGSGGATIHGDSTKWRAGKGVILLGRAEKKNTTYGEGFFNEAKIIWFRGGVEMDGSRVPDNALKEGDEVAVKIMLQWAARASLFKAWALAVSKSEYLRQGGDPDVITEAAITDAHGPALMAAQTQNGLMVNFKCTIKLNKAKTNVYPQIALEGGTLWNAPAFDNTTLVNVTPAVPMGLPAPPLAPAPGFGRTPPMPHVAPPFGMTPPLPNGTAQPPAWTPPALPVAPAVAAAFPPPVTTAFLPPSIAPPATPAFVPPPPVAPPVPAPQPWPGAPVLTRAQKEAAIKLKNPHLANANLSMIPDAQLDLYL